MQIRNILLVDDDADDQLFFQDVLNEIDPHITCDIANNGLEGMDKLNACESAPDIIFLDLNMPYMNGYDFLHILRHSIEFTHIPVVIFTTSNNEKDVELSRESGANRYLTKPHSLQILRQQLEKIIYSPEITSKDDLLLV